MRASLSGAALLLLAWPCFTGVAHAQEPLPPLPPPAEEAPPAAALPSSTQPTPPVLPSAAPSAAPAPPQYPYAPPPPGPELYSQVERRHAPRYSLWLGGRLGFLADEGALYINDPNPPPGSSGIETTGDFVRPGLALEGDIGVRLSRRYIPYVTLELGLVGAGRRFEGTPTSASTSFAGVGFRYLAGDVDSVAFAGDISLGVRTFRVSNASGSWSASGFEIVRLGFGAEIRASTLFTVSPMLTLSGGSLTDASGHISFSPNQPDGQTAALYSGAIPSWAQQSYFVIILGCGAHLDLFGK